MRTMLLFLVLVAGCATRTPRVAVGTLAEGLDAFLAAHPADADQPIRADLVTRTDGASYHVVQIASGEPLHRHRSHDVTVLVLRGHGTFRRAGEAFAIAAGDAVLVPHGVVHGFTNRGRGRAVTLAVFTPPLDAPDSEPARDVD